MVIVQDFAPHAPSNMCRTPLHFSIVAEVVGQRCNRVVILKNYQGSGLISIAHAFTELGERIIARMHRINDYRLTSSDKDSCQIFVDARFTQR